MQNIPKGKWVERDIDRNKEILKYPNNSMDNNGTSEVK